MGTREEQSAAVLAAEATSVSARFKIALTRAFGATSPARGRGDRTQDATLALREARSLPFSRVRAFPSPALREKVVRSAG